MLTLLLLLSGTMLAAPLAVRLFDARAGWVLALVPAAAFVWFCQQIGPVAGGSALTERVDWVPALEVALVLRLDGLSLLFALLVSGVGTLIVLYTSAYLEEHRHLGRFYAYLIGFMTAMLGLVLADDLIALFVFWELTSIASFLLIGFFHTRADSRRAALQALLITGGGGLALLAGLLLLGQAGQGWQFSQLAASGQDLTAHPGYPAIVALILIGCFTKSAQLPFHLWLPNAMAAPTPVSAYLHSATMVKAGIYLLARLNPVLGGTTGWGAVLVTVGAATAVLGAVLAIRQTDLKRLLAYTTVAVLGQLTMLIGTNTAYGLQAFVVYLLAHASYKGALFMAVGAIDHATGTREVGRLGGLIRFMPLTGAAVGLAAFSNAGLPPAFGFIAKEFKYAGLIEMGIEGWAVTAVMVLTNALLLAAAGILFLHSFFGPKGDYPHTPHEVPFSMWLGPALLALLGFVFGAFNAWPEKWLVTGAVQAVARGPMDVHLYLWGGLTPAVLASVLTVGLGVLAYRNQMTVRRRLAEGARHLPLDGDRTWDRLLRQVFALAGQVAAAFQHGSLRGHVLALLAAIGALALAAGVWGGAGEFHGGAEVSPTGAAGCLLAALGALAACRVQGRLAMVAFLGASGLGVALFFFAMRAPDVAMTQIMVETLTVIFLALVLARLPASRARGRGLPGTRVLRLAVAVLFGAGTAAALLATLAAPLPPGLADWFVARSLPDGLGQNVVNVILVDFRALDTLGEILVVALAALGAVALLAPPGANAPPGNPVRLGAAFRSPVLHHALRPLAGLMLLVSLAVLWRGHNLPGGGFIGGLIGASGFALVALGFGPARAFGLMRLAPVTLILAGLGCAAGAGLIGLAGPGVYLQAVWLKGLGLPLGTPLLFDVGVYLTVMGAVLQLLFGLMAREGWVWK